MEPSLKKFDFLIEEDVFQDLVLFASLWRLRGLLKGSLFDLLYELGMLKYQQTAKNSL